jgi:CheY-like chemotaxis protein
VDDTDEVRMLIRRALAAHGYQVDMAATLAQANALDPVRYDVVLIDAHLGAERGTDLIDAMLAVDPAAAARCLVITGGVTGPLPRGVACLHKPFRPADLLSALAALRRAGDTAPDGVVSAPVLAAAVPAGSPVPAAAAVAAAGAVTPAVPSTATAVPAAAAAAAPSPGPRPAAGRPAGQAVRMPAAWRLLSLVRGLRSTERATLADFVHDGPIQELAAASMALQLPGRTVPADVTGLFGELEKEIAAAGRALRYLTDGDWPFLPPGAGLPDVIRQRTAWLPLSAITVDIRQTCAALRAEAPLIADVVELALFLMTSDGPLSQAQVCVQAGDDDAEIVLTLTQPGDVRDWAADPGQLAELASILGGTAHTERGPARWQVRITLPRQCAVDDRRY